MFNIVKAALIWSFLIPQLLWAKYQFTSVRSDVCFEKGDEIYVVERLTHLSEILYSHNLKPMWCANCSVSVTLELNNLPNPDKLYPGTKIRLPKKCHSTESQPENSADNSLADSVNVIDDAADSANAKKKNELNKKKSKKKAELNQVKSLEVAPVVEVVPVKEKPIETQISKVDTNQASETIKVIEAIKASEAIKADPSLISKPEEFNKPIEPPVNDYELRAKIAEEKLQEAEEKLKSAEKRAEEKQNSKSRAKKLNEAQAEAAEARAAAAEARAKAAEERAKAADLAAKEAEKRALEARLNKKPIKVVALNKMWAEPYFVFNQLTTEGNGIRSVLVSDVGLGSKFYLQKNYTKTLDYYVASNLYLINMSETISGTSIANSLQYSFGLLGGVKYFYTPRFALMAQTQINRELFVKPPATTTEEIQVVSGFNYQVDGLVEYNFWNYEQYFVTGDAKFSYYLPTVAASLAISSGIGIGGGVKLGRKFGWGRVYFDAHYGRRSQNIEEATFAEQILFLSTGFVYLF